MPHSSPSQDCQPDDGALSSLYMQVLCLGSVVTARLKGSLQGLRDNDTAIARDVLASPDDADDLDMRIDDLCIEELVQGGCVAGKLRAVICISKAITDLERIERQASRIAEQTLQLYAGRHVHPGRQLIHDVYAAGGTALELLQGALESFESLDEKQARAVACRQRELVAVIDSMLSQAADFLARDPRNVGQTTHLILMMSEIECIGEHARDLAEYVYYMVDGYNREPCARGEYAAETSQPAHAMDQTATI